MRKGMPIEEAEKELVIHADMTPNHVVSESIATLLAEYHSFKSAYDQVRWERDVAIEQLSEIGKSLGEKMDDIKAQQQEIKRLELKQYEENDHE